MGADAIRRGHWNCLWTHKALQNRNSSSSSSSGAASIETVLFHRNKQWCAHSIGMEKWDAHSLCHPWVLWPLKNKHLPQRDKSSRGAWRRRVWFILPRNSGQNLQRRWDLSCLLKVEKMKFLFRLKYSLRNERPLKDGLRWIGGVLEEQENWGQGLKSPVFHYNSDSRMPRNWILKLSAAATSNYPLHPPQGAVLTSQRWRRMPPFFLIALGTLQRAGIYVVCSLKILSLHQYLKYLHRIHIYPGTKSSHLSNNSKFIRTDVANNFLIM